MGKAKDLIVDSPSKLKGFEDILQSGRISIVMVYAEWCGACHRFRKNVWNPMLKKSAIHNRLAIRDDMIPKSKVAKPWKFDYLPSLILVDENGAVQTFEQPDGSMKNAMRTPKNLDEMVRIVNAPVKPLNSLNSIKSMNSMNTMNSLNSMNSNEIPTKSREWEAHARSQKQKEGEEEEEEEEEAEAEANANANANAAEAEAEAKLEWNAMQTQNQPPAENMKTLTQKQSEIQNHKNNRAEQRNKIVATLTKKPINSLIIARNRASSPKSEVSNNVFMPTIQVSPASTKVGGGSLLKTLKSYITLSKQKRSTRKKSKIDMKRRTRK